MHPSAWLHSEHTRSGLQQAENRAGPSARRQAPDRPVQRRQGATTRQGKGEQVRVADLAMPDDQRPVELSAYHAANVICPELVPVHPGDLVQQFDGRSWRYRMGYDRRVRGDSYKAILRRWARRPAEGLVLREPRVRSGVVNVGRPCQRDQNVDVQERDPALIARGHASSSSARATSCGVIGAASSGTANIGKFPVCRRGAGRRPRRARSDSTLPTARPSAWASARAACKTSSSMVMVVRISTS